MVRIGNRRGKKAAAAVAKPPKTKTLKAVVGKVLDRLVSKVIALHNLESAPGGSSSSSSSLPISSMLPKLRGRKSKAAGSGGDEDLEDEEPPRSSYQSLHKQLKQQQLEQKQVELDVSRMTKRQIAAAYARNVILVEQLKQQQLQFQQQHLFNRQASSAAEGDETIIFESHDGGRYHRGGHSLNKRSRDIDELLENSRKKSSSYPQHSDDDDSGAADPFEESDSENEEEDEEDHNLNSKHRKIKKAQDSYYSQSSQQQPQQQRDDNKVASKRGRPRRTVEFAGQPKSGKRNSNDSVYSDTSLSPRSSSRRQQAYHHETDSSRFSPFDALAAAANQESSDNQTKRKRGRPPKEKNDSSSSAPTRKSSNPFAIPVSRNSWSSNDAILMDSIGNSSFSNDSSGIGGDGGSIIKRRRLGELKITVDGSATGNSRNNLHSLVGGGINALNSLGGLSTAGKCISDF